MARPVHGRMQVILPPGRYAAWLDGPAAVPALLAGPSPADALKAVPVGPYVNHPQHEGPGACCRTCDAAAFR
jgi:putative SOS response-associated peptidase YedK